MVIKPTLQNYKIKTFNLELNISLKAPNLHCVICSEMNTASITNKRLLEKGRGSYEFMFALKIVTFYCKKIVQLIT